MTSPTFVVIGAGPAGLTAAWELARRGARPLVLERATTVGGLARTEQFRGYRFDVGGHRFFTREATVQRLWQEMLGSQFVRVSRLSRIYYRGRFFDYPLRPLNALSNLGGIEAVRVVASYAAARIRPTTPEATFEDWVRNRFGRRLYETFFRGYTEKVWGIPARAIRADWAAQRIRGLSLIAAVTSALFGTNGAKTLTREFHYPVLGPGMMWDRFRDRIEEAGGSVRVGAGATRIRHHGGRVVSVLAGRGDAEIDTPADHVISTMPLPQLTARLDPPAPPEVRRAAEGLRYRAMVVVCVIVRRHHLFPDTWLYIHDPEVRVGRIQNFRNWSPALLPDSETTSLGLEYFCDEGDAVWSASDDELRALATDELAGLGLAASREVVDAVAVRQPEAYPIYDEGYDRRVALVRRYLSGISGLQTIGRNGMHRYNNQDHSMLAGMLAARRALGEPVDPWSVNTDPEYHEAPRPPRSGT